MKKILGILVILSLIPTLALSAKQTVNNGETFGQARTKINANYTELYAQAATKWATGTAYTSGNQLVVYGGNIYVCTTSHTAGTFATDLAASKWKLWGSDIYAPSAVSTVRTTAGGGSTTAPPSEAAVGDALASAGGSMVYPGAGVPVSTGSAWGASITLGTGVSTALGNAVDSTDGLATYDSIPAITWGTGLTDTSDTISVTYPVTAEAWSGSGWNGDTDGLQRNDAYDYLHLADTDDDGLPDKLDLSSAGLVKTSSSGVISVATAGTDYTYKIASGTSALGTSAISTDSCATVVTTSATGVATTDVINWGFNGDPTSTTGYNPAGDLLFIVAYPSADNVNFKVCNKSGYSITPGSMTLNWRVDR